MLSSELPDALEEALARVIAAERKQWIKEREHIEAESRALIAEARAEVLSLRAAMKEQADAEIARLREALAQVRDGRDGIDGVPGEKGAQGEPGPAGEPGKDAEPEAVVEIVLARMPPPEQGPPGRDADPDEVAEKAAAIVLKRMPVPENGRDGRDGIDGKDVDPEVIESLVSEKVAAVVAALPPPEKGEPGKDGRDGVDGKDVDPEVVEALLSEKVAMAVAALPPPEKGERGDPGEDVDMDTVAVMVEEATRRSVADLPVPKDGKDADPELMRQMIYEEVAKLPPAEPGRDGKDAVVDYDLIVGTVCAKVEASLPPPEKGEPGRDGNDAVVDYDLLKGFVAEEAARLVAELPRPEKGEKGDRGDQGERGIPGRDGADIIELLTNSENMVVATLSDGRIKVIGGPVVGVKGDPGEPGRDGKDGQDGLSFQSFQFDVEHDGERKWILKWSDAAGKSITREYSVPTLIYRDIYREGRAYARGDAVTFGGCVWIALQDTSEKPGNGCKDWRLSVKAGGPGASAYSIARDLGFRGSQAEWIESLKGERGPEGRPGRDFVLKG